VADVPDWGAGRRADIAFRADDSLVAAVEAMWRSLRLTQDTSMIVCAIKNTINEAVPPHDYTVLQALCEREREDAFNQFAASVFPEEHLKFEHGIRDFVVSQEGRTSARRVKKVVRNAWKQDPAADRRIREMQNLPPDQFRSPYKGRPELYNPFVVRAFEAAIAHAANRENISWTRRTADNRSEGAMLDVLVAAVRWAMCIAWQTSAPPNREPPIVRAEGLLRILKSHRH
jgi:hypothetical protein